MGEVSVDVTITPRGSDNKLRLGGIAHAARGLWAIKQPYAVAAFLPNYLEASARKYLGRFDCQQFTVMGHISGAPNVTLIFDPTEVDDQEYDDLLRDNKTVEPAFVSNELHRFSDALIFPGAYDLASACKLLSKNVRLHIDVAYDIDSVAKLRGLPRKIDTLFLSTSSELFRRIGMSGIPDLISALRTVKFERLILKENRGGSRLHIRASGATEGIPAQLDVTANSVGVGDVFDAAYLAGAGAGPIEASWRASYASAAYAQTTEPDLFKTYVQREARLSLADLQGLGGSLLAWERRQDLNIYLAAPDFADADRTAIDRAVSSLKYHNFKVRRPIKEIGEIPKNSDAATLAQTYRRDIELLQACDLVFAIPTQRDPGTLVEIGVAIARGIPVVVYDPAGEANNTMVMAGAMHYSRDLDACLNAAFLALTKSTQAAKGGA
jgi:nucleoside 2-deoxyribosyltransferase